MLWNFIYYLRTISRRYGGLLRSESILMGDRADTASSPSAQNTTLLWRKTDFHGKVAIVEEISTTGEPAAIGFAADRNNLTADGRDISHITVGVLDTQCRVVPGADNKNSFEIQGEGTIIGVDNGNLLAMRISKASAERLFTGCV